VNKHIVEKKWMCNNTVAGVVTLVYDTEKHELANNLTRIQKEFFKEILSVQRLNLSEVHTLEIIALKGISARLTNLADKLISEKGIQHGKLTMSRVD
jgi:CopG family nickel-responsive transcriptional regulator